MSFTRFSPGDIIKSSEVNTNFSISLPTTNAICDTIMLNTTNIDVMTLIDTPVKLADLFTADVGSNSTVNTTNTTAEYNATSDFYASLLDLSDIILEPSFETVASWTFSELDTKSRLTGERSSDWSSVGTYSYKLRFNQGVSDTMAKDNYAQILQSVDFTDIKTIRFDYKRVFSGTGIKGLFRFRVYIGATKILDSAAGSDVQEFEYDCSAITGSQDLIFQLYLNGDANIGSTNVEFYIDNIRTLFTDSYVESASTTIGTDYVYAYVRPKLYEAIPTGADITCNISLDGGSTFTAESDINEIIDISALTDTGDLVVKMNLNTDGTVTSKVLGWACLLYK